MENMENTELTLAKRGKTIAEFASSFAITSENEYQKAASFLVDVKSTTAAVKDYWKQPKAAAKQAHSAICDKENEMLAPLKEAETIVKGKMATYFQRKEEEQRKEAEVAAALRQQEVDRLLEEAIASSENGNNEEAGLLVAIAQMVDDIPPSHSQPAINAPGTSIRKVWKAKVVDPTLVPAYVNGIEIREISQSKLNDLARMSNGAAVVPGVEFYQESTVYARSK